MKEVDEITLYWSTEDDIVDFIDENFDQKQRIVIDFEQEDFDTIEEAIKVRDEVIKERFPLRELPYNYAR